MRSPKFKEPEETDNDEKTEPEEYDDANQREKPEWDDEDDSFLEESEDLF